MASSSRSRKKYDVFVSFRGEDVRFNFWSHLHKALKQKSITFVDDNIRRGDNIPSALLTAIEDSEFAVVILSEKYASSWWCLEELAHILHCNNQRNEQIHVVPVFYHVDPSDVRKQSGSYEVAFAQLEKSNKYKIDKLNQWRAALTTVANLAGFTVPIDRSESELIERIVEDIAKKLNALPSRIDHLKGLVGIEMSIDRMRPLLLVDSSPEARVVGIWAMGGSGKTTLARVIFELFKYQFEGSCFLDNVREGWKNGERSSVRDALFSALLGGEKYVLESAKERLCHKKVLIVLDDVDDAEYFEYLVGDRDWLCPGSGIIITTRNKQVLKNIEVYEVHELELLDEDKALHLFSLHAFKKTAPKEGYEELSREVINYAGGVPLALKVLGCHLYSKVETIWRSALDKLKACPNRKILNILRISYDGLDDSYKEIFLAIACFFKGEAKDKVREMLDEDNHFEDGINNLIDNSLVTITNRDEVIQMHDLVEEMALHVAREELPEKPRWLWDVKDINHVFTDKVGRAMVKGIILYTGLKPKILDAFKELGNLRFLKIDYLHQASLAFLPDKLRYLNWFGSTFKSLPSSFVAQNLVQLHMPYSKLERLWNGTQDLGNLKFVNLSFSENLVNIQDLSRANLKTLDLHGCKSLVEVPSLRFSKQISIKKQDLKRGTLSLSGCSNLKRMPKMSGNIGRLYLDSTGVEELDFSHLSLDDSLLSLVLRSNEHLKKVSSNICKLKSLKYLDLSYCSSFNELPAELPKNLVELNLSGTAIEQVPASSLECIPGLCNLGIKNCKKLETLPNNICMLTSLHNLDLSGCLSFKKLPDELPKNLETLNLIETAIEEVPASSFECIPGLWNLEIKNCKKLETLPNNICKLMSLKGLDLSGCFSFKVLPDELPKSIKILYLNDTKIEQVPASSFECIPSLLDLEIKNCKKLETLPDNICMLTSLKYLDLSGCSSFKKLPDKLPENLKRLNLIGTALERVPASSFECIPGLLDLQIESCSKLEALPNSICMLTSLQYLDLSGCLSFKKLPDKVPQNLKRLNLIGTAIERVPASSFECIPGLLDLQIERCSKLEALPNSICMLTSLQYLDLSGCLSFKKLPDKLPENLKRLNLAGTAIERVPASSFECIPGLLDLQIERCAKLETLPNSICMLTSLQRLDLSGCLSFQNLPDELPKSIKFLYLNDTAIEQVPPSSFECLPSLEVLKMTNCTWLQTLPTSICKLTQLAFLDLSHCSEFKSFPEILEPMENFTRLHLNGTGIKDLPKSIDKLVGLCYLLLGSCQNLEQVDSIYNMKRLQYVDLSCCPKLQSSPVFTPVGFFPEIELEMTYSDVSKVIDWLYGLSPLPMLDPSGTSGHERIIVNIEWHSHIIIFQVVGSATPQNIAQHSSWKPSEFSMEDRNVVTSELQRYFLRAATEYFRSRHEELGVSKYPRISFCLEGNSIPKWFNHQSEQSSIELQFSPDWHDTDFLGFAICVAVDVVHVCRASAVQLNVACAYRFTMDRKHNLPVSLRQTSDYQHWIFVWYLYRDNDDYDQDAKGASFRFSVEQRDDQNSHFHWSARITNCGIRVL